MKDLTILNIKCLENMPMILDAISNSVNKLQEIFNPLYEDLRIFTKKLIPAKSYSMNEEYNNGIIYAFGDEGDYKRKYLVELTPDLQIRYKIVIKAKAKRIDHSFEIEFGYVSNVEQNVMYFQLFESPETNVLSKSMRENIEQSISSKWIYGETEDSVYIEFAIDENVSEEKIKDCCQSFKEHFLKPVIAQLG